MAYLTLSIVASALAISSYLAYTTAGLDFEVATATGVDVYYYRLRWDDGSTWAGLAVQPVDRHHESLDWFDPGGTLLDAPTRPEHRTWPRALGFWWVADVADDPYMPVRYPGSSESVWCAVPSWLVILGLWHRPLRRASARVGLGSASSPASSRGPARARPRDR